MNGSSSDSELKLQEALKRLSTTMEMKFKDAVDTIGESITESIDSTADAAVLGMRKIKSEINITSTVNKSPLGFVAGSFLSGALFEYVTVRIKGARLSSPGRHFDQSNVKSQNLTTPLMYAVAAWGLKRLIKEP